MQALSIIILVVSFVMFIVVLVVDMKRAKDVKNMTLPLFEERLISIRDSRSGSRFIRFLKENAVFIKLHEAEVAEIFARVFPKSDVSNKK